MAKRGALEHPKTVELAATLEIDECYALGILEAFWHHVARYFPAGDVSPAKPALLSRTLRYTGDGARLWAALLEVGFLESTQDGRLIVHDWSEHADDAVHMSLARKGLYFADGTKPRYTRLSQKERDQADALYAQQCAQDTHENAQRAQDGASCAHSVRTALPKPSHGLSHGTSKPNAETENTDMAAGAAESVPSAPRFDPRDWEAFVQEYPPRNGDRGLAKGREKFMALIKSGVPPGDILDGVRRYRAWTDAEGSTGTQYVKQIPTWLSGKNWLEDWAIRTRGNANGQSRHHSSAAHESPEDKDARLEREYLALYGPPPGNSASVDRHG